MKVTKAQSCSPNQFLDIWNYVFPIGNRLNIYLLIMNIFFFQVTGGRWKDTAGISSPEGHRLGL